MVFNCTKDRNGIEILKKITTKPFIKFDHAIFCTNLTYITNQYKPGIVIKCILYLFIIRYLLNVIFNYLQIYKTIQLELMKI